MLLNRQWRIARRPVGMARESDFEWHQEPVPSPTPGQALVRNQFLSVDPAGRVWMRPEDAEWPAQPLGAVMRGFTIGVVEQSRSDRLPVGTRISGLLGWQDYAIIDENADGLTLLGDHSLTPEVQLGLLGHVGLAAYFGMLAIGRPRPNETLVVSSAAGAVGSLAGQIGKLLGCRVVGIAGSNAKCGWITRELGFDAAINYKSEPVFKRLQVLCPRGIDIYFDNVGGPILEDVLALINSRARIVVCGMLSLYNDVAGTLALPGGPNNLLNLMAKRASMEGFQYRDFHARGSEAIDTLLAWHRSGRLRYRLNLVDGLQNAPGALTRLFEGSNFGKLAVRMS